MTRALYIGRFQPFHLGHLNALRWILRREDLVIIGIGSAQYSHSFRNPFTAGERVEMIWRVLRAENLLHKCIITLIPDTNGQHALWVSVVLQNTPRFDIVYTNDPLTQLLFKEANIKVRNIPFFDRNKYCATTIRKLIAENKPWEHLVHPEVAKYIKEIKGDERIRFIYRKITS